MQEGGNGKSFNDLIRFLMSEQALGSVIMVVAGAGVALIGATLIKSDTWAIITSILGAVISITATEHIIKIMPK